MLVPLLIASEASFLGTPSALCSLPQLPPTLRADQLIESPVYQMPWGTQDMDNGPGLHCASITYELDDLENLINSLSLGFLSSAKETLIPHSWGRKRMSFHFRTMPNTQ